MIIVDQAIQIAIDYVRKLFAGDPSDPAGDFRLEEVEAKDDGSWDVTV